MTNTRKEIGGWTIVSPEKVVRLGVIIENLHVDQLTRIWGDSEKQSEIRLQSFVSKDRFFEEIFTRGDMTYSFRYYTPKENRKRAGK